MAQITLKGNTVNTLGDLPPVGEPAPDFTLVAGNLKEITLATFGEKKKVLNIFPSVDTATCATSVRKFNADAAAKDNTVVINISADLPFAMTRFCGAAGLENVVSASTFRGTFAKDYQLEMTDSVLKGLCSRVVIVLDADNKVVYTEQVGEIADEPNYAAALKNL